MRKSSAHGTASMFDRLARAHETFAAKSKGKKSAHQLACAESAKRAAAKARAIAARIDAEEVS